MKTGKIHFFISDCGEPSALPGAQRTFSGTEVGYVANHSCSNGYVDVANVITVESTCLLGGNWSTVFINCSSIYVLPSQTAYFSIVYWCVFSTFELLELYLLSVVKLFILRLLIISNSLTLR
jgi:hypothetical protein